MKTKVTLKRLKEQGFDKFAKAFSTDNCIFLELDDSIATTENNNHLEILWGNIVSKIIEEPTVSLDSTKPIQWNDSANAGELGYIGFFGCDGADGLEEELVDYLDTTIREMTDNDIKEYIEQLESETTRMMTKVQSIISTEADSYYHNNSLNNNMKKFLKDLTK